MTAPSRLPVPSTPAQPAFGVFQERLASIWEKCSGGALVREGRGEGGAEQGLPSTGGSGGQQADGVGPPQPSPWPSEPPGALGEGGRHSGCGQGGAGCGKPHAALPTAGLPARNQGSQEGPPLPASQLWFPKPAMCQMLGPWPRPALTEPQLPLRLRQCRKTSYRRGCSCRVWGQWTNNRCRHCPFQHFPEKRGVGGSSTSAQHVTWET